MIMLFEERKILMAALLDLELNDISRHVIFAPSSTNIFMEVLDLLGLAALWQMSKVIITG